MTQPQIIVFSIIAITSIISFLINTLSKNEKTISNSAVVLFIMIAMLFLMSVVVTSEMNYLRNISKGKCPEYEKIDNVYKLK